MAMDHISHLIYILCSHDQNQLNYNQFSEGVENAEKRLVLKGLITGGKKAKELL